METSTPSDRPPSLPEEPPENLREVAGPSEGLEKGDGREKSSDCRMPSPTMHNFRCLLLLLALVATQLLLALGFALRWLGHVLEALAGEKER